MKLLAAHDTSSGVKISLTPLIDVVFILLLFFMLSAHYARWQQMPVSLPVKGSETRALSAVVPELQLFSDGRIVLAQQVIEPASLAQHLAGQTHVVIRPEAALSLQQLLLLMEQLQRLQIQVIQWHPSLLSEGRQP